MTESKHHIRKGFENNNKYQLYGRCKGKSQCERQKCFPRRLSLYRNSNRIFAKKNPFCLNVGEGGQTICEIQNQNYGGLDYGENNI